MIFAPKEIELKNGATAQLRTADTEDAAVMLDYFVKSCGETEFLISYPEDLSGKTVEAERAWIDGVRESPNILNIVCFIDGVLAGNCELRFNSKLKNSHRASIGITVRKAYWNIGIGSAMFREMISAAEERGIEFLELEVVEGNERAIGLYEKFGFKTVSERPNVLKLKDGTYRGEFYMQKYL